MNILSVLKEIPEFKDVPDNQLQWLIDESECTSIARGEYLFKAGQEIDRLIIILQGKFTLKVAQNNHFRVIDVLKAHSITGYLPYSRANTAVGYAEASEDAHVLILAKNKIKQMIIECHDLTTVLVHVMSSRIRQFTKMEQQNDKMMALGKLSAGLAHELNNPSAAVVRSARELSKHLRYLPEKFKNVIKIRISDEQIDAINKLLFAKITSGKIILPMIKKMDREDGLREWLDAHNVEESDELATNFVDFGIAIDDLKSISSILNPTELSPVFNWFNQILSTEKLVSEIEEASQRINSLVCSVKSYTHMDQAPEKVAVDVHEGINNTITMLNHKIKKNNIEVIRSFEKDLPMPAILPSEMNQVWTNLIDNAIDAMENSEKRVLEIETKKDDKYVVVNISDSGNGIAEESIDKIFEPFFTTKPIGKGTGLGLEVVHQIVTMQHSGNIMVNSQPGNTTFTVYIPIKPE